MGPGPVGGGRRGGGVGGAEREMAGAVRSVPAPARAHGRLEAGGWRLEVGVGWAEREIAGAAYSAHDPARAHPTFEI